MPKTTIMISGPHAIGKSTTAEKLAEKHGLLYVSSFAGKIAKDMGYDINKCHTPDEILEYQQKVLKAFQMHYEATLDVPTVYDRSPLDFAVYTMMQLHGVTDKETIEKAKLYVKECINTTMGYCDLLVIPEADLTEPYEDKGNRPKFSEDQVAYRKMYNEVLKALANNCWTVNKLSVPADKQFDDRVSFISDNLEGLDEGL